MLNKRWRRRIIDTEYINERAITTTILVNRQHIKLMSVYFPTQKYADHHKRGDWFESWLMLHDYSALNTMFRKSSQKQTTFISPKRKRKTN